MDLNMTNGSPFIVRQMRGLRRVVRGRGQKAGLAAFSFTEGFLTHPRVEVVDVSITFCFLSLSLLMLSDLLSFRGWRDVKPSGLQLMCCVLFVLTL
jgi:hypothetical protein